jgi:hypothetical protein
MKVILGFSHSCVIGTQTTFSRDLEPEYLALSSDGKTVYVMCQENSAIAIFDLETKKIKDIKPLAAKSWASTTAGLDASDRDPTGTINMQKWNIHGMLQADTIDIYKASDGKEYLVIANEGDDKEYKWEGLASGLACEWTEMTRGASMTRDEVESAGPAQADLFDNTKLGRIKVGLFDQRASPTSGNYSKIYTMGGRSFSIINPETMATVYDSGSLMEEILKDTYPKIFNSDNSNSKSQEAVKDERCGQAAPYILSPLVHSFASFALSALSPTLRCLGAHLHIDTLRSSSNMRADILPAIIQV